MTIVAKQVTSFSGMIKNHCSFACLCTYDLRVMIRGGVFVKGFLSLYIVSILIRNCKNGVP